MAHRTDEDKLLTHPALRCSWCKKTVKEVEFLIQAPNAYVCSECVDVCNEIIAEGRAGRARDAMEKEART